MPLSMLGSPLELASFPTFAESLAGATLDNACSGMRRVQWNAEAKAQGQAGQHEQKQLCVALWARPRRQGAFESALAQLAEGVGLPMPLRLSDLCRVTEVTYYA